MTGEPWERIDRAAVAEAVRRMNEEDLRYLNRLIVDRLKLLGQAQSIVMLARFNVGDRVYFLSNTGDRKTGRVIRLNKKTASVITDDGQNWNVHPGYLSPLGPGDLDIPEGS